MGRYGHSEVREQLAEVARECDDVVRSATELSRRLLLAARLTDTIESIAETDADQVLLLASRLVGEVARARTLLRRKRELSSEAGR